MDILTGERLLILAESAEPHTQEEKDQRDTLWAQFLPYLVIALAVYSLLAICWILWNIYTYRRDLTNAKKGQTVGRLYEKWRLLSIYDQVPLPSSREAMRNTGATIQQTSVADERNRRQQVNRGFLPIGGQQQPLLPEWQQ